MGQKPIDKIDNNVVITNPLNDLGVEDLKKLAGE